MSRRSIPSRLAAAAILAAVLALAAPAAASDPASKPCPCDCGKHEPAAAHAPSTTTGSSGWSAKWEDVYRNNSAP